MTMPITLVLTRAGNRTLSADEVKAIIAGSEGKKSDANNARGHALQHVQQTDTYRKTDYSEKRAWNELSGEGSHSCFKTERQQAEMVCDVLMSNAGKDALRQLNAGAKQVKVRSNIGAGETVVSQGSLGGEFGVFCDDKPAKGLVVELHSKLDGGTNMLHVRSAYPVA